MALFRLEIEIDTPSACFILLALPVRFILVTMPFWFGCDVIPIYYLSISRFTWKR